MEAVSQVAPWMASQGEERVEVKAEIVNVLFRIDVMVHRKEVDFGFRIASCWVVIALLSTMFVLATR